MTIRGRVVVLLAVPVLVLLVLMASMMWRAAGVADEARYQAEVVAAVVGPGSLTTSLVDERSISLLESSGLTESLQLRVGSTTEARDATDDQLAALSEVMARHDQARDIYGSVVESIVDSLDGLRADVDAEVDGADEGYSDLVEAMLDANTAMVATVSDAELWIGARLSELAAEQKETRARLIRFLIGSVGEDGMDRARVIDVGRELASYENTHATMATLATGGGPYDGAARDLFAALEAADLAGLARWALLSGEVDLVDLFEATSYEGEGDDGGLPTGDAIYDVFRTTVGEHMEAKASGRVAAATATHRVLLGVLVVSVLGAVAAVWWASRSITRPLQVLTLEATDAAKRLPAAVRAVVATPRGEDVTVPPMEPLEVAPGGDEVTDLRNTFYSARNAVISEAVEQAMLKRNLGELCVSLGRRNQNLLGRQLEFITVLEHNETDPDTLANLYRLDHLATRMRRNAESLLVLAGLEPPRKMAEPVGLVDVIRAALGEVEDYQRATLQILVPDDTRIVGAAATDMTHVVAELIENALVASPANQTVAIRVGATSHTGAHGCAVAIIDSGDGMSPEELAQANRRLAGTEPLTVSHFAHSGLYVAGRIAVRHGVTVRLHHSPGRGITATVDLPPKLLLIPDEPATGSPSSVFATTDPPPAVSSSNWRWATTSALPSGGGAYRDASLPAASLPQRGIAAPAPSADSRHHLYPYHQPPGQS